MFERLMTDRVTIRTQDGKSYPDVRASVQREMIFISQTSIPVRPGDLVIRTTPAGVEEVFIVEDPGFHQGLGGIPAGYQMRVRRADAAAPRSSHVIYNITGPNARFNIHSVDSSTNVVNQAPAELFAALNQVLQSRLPESLDRDELIRRTQALEADMGKKTFGQRYAEFMALAASHMETVGPFIPALTQLLTGQ
jgi:hypothetical protein